MLLLLVLSEHCFRVDEELDMDLIAAISVLERLLNEEVVLLQEKHY